MAEIRSALQGHLKPGTHVRRGQVPGIILKDLPGRDLVQIGVWRETLEEARGTLELAIGFAVPSDTRRSIRDGQITVFMIAPDKYWIAAPAADGWLKKLQTAVPIALGVVTELGHARSVLRISGPSARELMARHVAIDLDPSAFPAGDFASTGIHGIGVLLHHYGDVAGHPIFDLYLPRTFAASLAEAIAETAEPYGTQIEG